MVGLPGHRSPRHYSLIDFIPDFPYLSHIKTENEGLPIADNGTIYHLEFEIFWQEICFLVSFGKKVL